MCRSKLLRSTGAGFGRVRAASWATDLNFAENKCGLSWSVFTVQRSEPHISARLKCTGRASEEAAIRAATAALAARRTTRATLFDGRGICLPLRCLEAVSHCAGRNSTPGLGLGPTL